MLAPAKRWLTLGAIVVAHGAALYVLELCLVPSRPLQATLAPPLIVTFIRESTPVPAPTAMPWQPPGPWRKKILPAPAAPTAGEESGAITDWGWEARAAVQETLRHETAKSRQRAFAHRFPAPAAPDTGGVFGSEKENRRAGRVEDGEIFWVTDDCYFDFPRARPLPHAAGEFHLLTPLCKPAPQGGGSHMFEELTPDYLRRAPAR